MDHEPIDEQLYQAYKPMLFAIAYRMLGSVMDAEDIVQEAFIALHKAALAPIDNIKAYLCKIVTNRSIDRLRQLSRQRKVYVGPWLPEPLLTNEFTESDPSQAFMRKESISTAFLLLLQQLSWVERAVFILREVLEYEYEDIAEIVGKSSTNCRQIYHRAKRSIGKDEEAIGFGHKQVDQPANLGLVEQFVHALISSDMSRLLKLIATDATLYSDGGGKVTAAVRPILGVERIISFFTGILKKQPPDFAFKFCSLNGQTGMVVYGDGRIYSIFTFQIKADQLSDFYLMVNPDKLISFPLQFELM
ncbi:RNA polymerase sigma-70 factor [Paenibacillus psychroresistens]|uniref:RNA polymerase sigma-70 factor n=1 Tax=Paenibacillus psychroresistens TaxID=1778678 RepID=A0A6B8REX2_9BACL|nr:RNA polymerase sigma-70 factor [Paenibacillus psychroresistens]QGQ94063.1 RNA polymerase sigma-70 factor [Paenibacillus psychroresistens]